MTDYGHELEFGAFVTPDADQLPRVLELTQLAEVLGLDLVSIQDHPYQEKYADTWTLLSVLGARTSTIKLAPNVASLPLRPPVVLAKSAATLDLLTGGRVELGLGAGAFWDAIEAAGGVRRTPKEAVDALIEAIAVIRGFWAGGSLRFEGEHYPVSGLHAGPKPAHDIPIWLGAYGPRMMRVTGQLADGWVPSMGYADPPALPDLTERLDDAAVSAGRAPHDVRRIYNIFGSFGTGSGFLKGTPANWAEQLAELSLDLGFSTYIAGGDDPDFIRRFAEEVAPATRELVAKEREAQASGEAPPRVVEVVSTLRQAQDRPSSTHDLETPEAQLPTPTPDDGTRVSASQPWDESTRPTHRPAAEPAYTDQQRALPQHLKDIHDGLRQELEQVRDIVDQVRTGHLTIGAARSSINTMTMRQNNWTLGAYCEAYCRIVTGHHSLEDRSVFPHLRRSEPGLGPVLDRLEEEHGVIHGVLEEVDHALVALVGSEMTGKAGEAVLETLQEKVDLMTDTLLSHLAYEERELIGPLARHGFN